MDENRKKRITSKVIGSIILLILPKLIPIYYESVYYICLVIAIVIAILMELFNWHQKMDRRFYPRWQESRKKGIWITSLSGMPRPMISMTIIVLLGQLFGNGYTPTELIKALTPWQIVLMIAMLLAFAYLAGIAYWFEKEKRYNRIHNENNNEDTKP